MKILVPLNNEANILEYINVGADELYMGFFDLKWLKRFGKYADINRMSGFGEYANKYCFEEMIFIAKKIKKLNRSVFVTMNANSYNREQIEYIQEHYLPQIYDANMDGVIVSNLELGKVVKNYGITPVASTMCAIYNSEIAQIYKENGIKRLILPRDISLNEIQNISSKVSGLQLEIFFMRNGCFFSDCYCLGMHRPECGATCAMLRSHKKNIISTRKDFNHRHDIALNEQIYNKFFHNDACAMCALYRLIKMGVNSLKIVGRADNSHAVCKDIEITRRNIQIAESCSSEMEYLEKMIFPFNSIKNCCMGLSCYYPEVRFY